MRASLALLAVLVVAIMGCGDSTEYAASTGIADGSGTTSSPMAPRAAAPQAGAGQFRSPPIDQFAQPQQPDAPVENTEEYRSFADNEFQLASLDPLSTFAIDVDTGSYANVRRMLCEGRLPPADAVRIEEMINYFQYDDPPPADDSPFAVHAQVAACPWNTDHRLLRIALKGREAPKGDRPPANLVFLLDVSGSMDSPDKLPLLKAAFAMLVSHLSSADRVAIVTYAGDSSIALKSTKGGQKNVILDAIRRLEPGGSTNGGAGIQTAYEIAREHFIEGGVNRVILATDGDFNVGVTSHDELVRLIADKAKTGVFLNVLGFGRGNLKDAKMEQIADRGNGSYHYVDSLDEAKKVLVRQAGGTLLTIAKDVKIQVQFNPQRVGAYRLIGYENRLLRAQDFTDDTKDAGEIGAGHCVTALYEVVPAGKDNPLVKAGAAAAEEQRKSVAFPPAGAPGFSGDELLAASYTYKEPESDKSQPPRTIAVRDSATPILQAGDDLQFAAAVAAFGMVLRNSPHKGTADYGLIVEMAQEGIGQGTSSDAQGDRLEFLELVRRASAIASGEGRGLPPLPSREELLEKWRRSETARRLSAARPVEVPPSGGSPTVALASASGAAPADDDASQYFKLGIVIAFAAAAAWFGRQKPI
ncbi:MAG: VWA domain-containing protein [Planctomycetia bacterium]|nr:VWA domain-containing protein [Planctomycetia bacterium]